jgi:hypothetical protein
VIRDGGGSFECGLVENGWTDTPDEDLPALTFPTEADARAGFKYLVTEQVCEAADGPQRYTGRSMRDAHAPLAITAGE